MRVAPVSGDLLVKLALLGGAGLAAWWMLRAAREQLAAAVPSFALPSWAEVTDAVNPASDRNLAYRGTNAVGAAVSGNADWNLGAAAWELLNPGAVRREWEAVHGPVNTGGATGSWEVAPNPTDPPGLPPYYAP